MPKKDKSTDSLALTPVPAPSPALTNTTPKVDKGKDTTDTNDQGAVNESILKHLKDQKERNDAKDKAESEKENKASSMTELGMKTGDELLSAGKYQRKRGYDNSPIAQDIAKKAKTVGDVVMKPVTASYVQLEKANQWRAKMSTAAGEKRREVIGGVQTKMTEALFGKDSKEEEVENPLHPPHP